MIFVTYLSTAKPRKTESPGTGKIFRFRKLSV